MSNTFIDAGAAAILLNMSLKQFRRAVKIVGVTPMEFRPKRFLYPSAKIREHEDELKAATGRMGNQFAAGRARLANNK